MLAGWISGIGHLTSIVPGWPKMSPATILGFSLASVSLWCAVSTRAQSTQRTGISPASLGHLLALLVVVLGVFGLAADLAGMGPVFGMLGFRETVEPGALPATIAPATSFAMVLLGGSLLAAGKRGSFALAQALCLVVILVSLLGMVRYLYGGTPLPAYLGMSLPTACLSLVIAMGAVALTLEGGLLRWAFVAGPGLVLIRMALLPALAVPALIRWLLLNAQGAGWFSPSTGMGMFVVSATVVTVFFILGFAAQLNRIDSERTKSDAATQRLAMIVESSDDAIISKDLQGRVTSWNRGAEAIFGYTADEMLGASIRRLIPPDLEHEEDTFLNSVSRGESVDHYETRRITKQGKTIEISVTLSPMRDAAGDVVGISKVARDVTVQMAQAREIVRLSRLYAALSHVNQAIIGQHDREELFDEVCVALIDFGGFMTAWIALIDPEDGRIRAVRTRDREGRDSHAATMHANGEVGDTQAEVAIREGHTYVCNRLPDLEIAGHAGQRLAGSAAALPLRQAGRIIGCINVHADQAGFFQDKEMALLEEVAGDVSFALDKIENDVRHAEAEAALHASQLAIRDSEARYRTLFDYAPDGILISNQGNQFVDANLSMSAMLGYAKQELVGMHASDIVPSPEVQRIGLAVIAVRGSMD